MRLFVCLLVASVSNAFVVVPTTTQRAMMSPLREQVAAEDAPANGADGIKDYRSGMSFLDTKPGKNEVSLTAEEL
jgi:hypothetical protein